MAKLGYWKASKDKLKKRSYKKLRKNTRTWRNWQTRRFQVPVGDHMGSSPFIRTSKIDKFRQEFVDFFPIYTNYLYQRKKVAVVLLTKQKCMIYCGKQTNPSGFVCFLIQTNPSPTDRRGGESFFYFLRLKRRVYSLPASFL